MFQHRQILQILGSDRLSVRLSVSPLSAASAHAGYRGCLTARSGGLQRLTGKVRRCLHRALLRRPACPLRLRSLLTGRLASRVCPTETATGLLVLQEALCSPQRTPRRPGGARASAPVPRSVRAHRSQAHTQPSTSLSPCAVAQWSRIWRARRARSMRLQRRSPWTTARPPGGPSACAANPRQSLLPHLLPLKVGLRCSQGCLLAGSES